MKLCAKNKNWKLENTSKWYYVRFYGKPWHKKLLEYALNYLILIILTPFVYFIIVQLIHRSDKMTGVFFLMAIGVPAFIFLKISTEFQSTVVRLNFKDRFLTLEDMDPLLLNFKNRYLSTLSIPYETLLFDIEKSGELFNLFLIHTNVLIKDKGRIYAIETKQGPFVLKLKIWESDSYEEVENVKHILYTEYEKTANLGTHPYFLE
jgi:hypothetical protein